MKRIKELLSQKATLLKQCNALDQEFKREARDCEHHEHHVGGEYHSRCNHIEQVYGVCDPMICPFRGDMFVRSA